MISKIFVNLPVQDLDRSMTFFKAVGFSFNPQFTDKTAACMVMSDDIYAMLLTHEKFRSFAPKAVSSRPLPPATSHSFASARST